MKIKLISFFANLVFVANLAAVSFEWAVVTDQNQRRYQEDRYTKASIKDVNNKKLGDFFGVYDGHGGYTVSALLAEKLHIYFADALEKSKNEEKAFTNAFLSAEQRASWLCDDGSTALACYIDNSNMLHVAWVGDSRMVIDGGLITDDHKPDREDEKKRIERAGGKVVIHGVPRVNGLAVSRSIGDRKLKHWSKRGIIATPEYAQYQLSENNECMILASDGLWDVVSNAEAIQLTKENLHKNNSCKDAAQKLTQVATRRGSRDNITVMIVQFNWSKKN